MQCLVQSVISRWQNPCPFQSEIADFISLMRGHLLQIWENAKDLFLQIS